MPPAGVGVHPGLGVDQQVLGGRLQPGLGVELGEGVVRHALPPVDLGPEVGDDGDGVLYVADGREGRGRGGEAGDVRYDMFWTEVTPGRTDGSHVEVLIQGNGDA